MALPIRMALAAFTDLFLLPRDWLAFTPVLLFVAFGYILAVAYLQFTGYRLLGAESATFRQVLLETLCKLDLAYEDAETRIQLSALDVELHVGIRAWVGTAFIRLSGRGHGETLRQIMRGVHDEFKTAGYRARLRIFWISLALGILTLGLAVLVESAL